MDYRNRFRDPLLAGRLVAAIAALDPAPLQLMEVCGTHTTVIFRFGIKQLLPESIRLISGPGCPVCVTPTAVIDAGIDFVRRRRGILATFGDLLRVPGSESSLEQERAAGGSVQIVYSVLDALQLARREPDQNIVFFAVGFETTAPGIAAAVETAARENLNNFFILPANKIMPPALRVLLETGEVKLDGFICPGHVSVIIGAEPYAFIAGEFGIPCVIAGFEPLDVLQSIYMLVKQHVEQRAGVEIQYRRMVREQGNVTAGAVIDRVFEPVDSEWRGLGIISKSGLALREEFRRFDGMQQFGLSLRAVPDPEGCRCGDVLRGLITPHQCPLFGFACSPLHPVGSCMVSAEGACSIYHKYARKQG